MALPQANYLPQSIENNTLIGLSRFANAHLRDVYPPTKTFHSNIIYKDIRIGHTNKKGILPGDFQQAFSRYHRLSTSLSLTHRQPKNGAASSITDEKGQTLHATSAQ
ncbi:hypothetical protein [Methylomonas koyamae]|uniref:hypothetical protein n=1 Tax=Methylomonas koyamae TaxID=702114 RepID=UPI0011289E03|nr:hypothetical protein [Methylomonas koyamae]